MMRRRILFLVALCCLMGAFLSAQSAPANVAEAASAAAPADRNHVAWWPARHAQILEKVKSRPDVGLVLAGDSITNNYDKAKEPDENFAPIWQKYYAPRKAMNLGFSGDLTRHLLWRLQQGEVDGIHPKVVVILIGTNDTNHGLRTGVKAEELIPKTEAGIDAIVAEFQKRLPETKILLLGILPSGISAEKTAADQAINKYLAAKYKDDARVTFLDISYVFYEDGKLNEKIFYDPRMAKPAPCLHPDTVGQRRMAEAIEPTLAKLLGESPIKSDSAH